MMTEADQAQTDTTATVKARLKRRVRTGIVESNAAHKTIKVRIDRRVKHAKYGKYLKRSTRLQAHDEKNEANCGDTVEIVECRPLSKTKSWRLARIVRKSVQD